MTKVAVAGTFNRFHKGHRKLIDVAFENGDEVFIGITSDEMASHSRKNILPFSERKAIVEKYAKTKNKPFSIGEINDPFVLDKMKEMNVLVVSKETEKNGTVIRKKLSEEGKELKLVIVDLVLAYDGKKISSTEIVEGKYDSEGKPKN